MFQPSEEIPDSDLQNLSLSKPTRKSRKQRKTSPTLLQDGEVATSIPTSLAEMPTPLRLLVCSIGNPAPYTNTLHSAGHSVLTSLAASLSYPPFQKSREYGNGLVSEGVYGTLWQSRSMMNISGAGVSAAWRAFQKMGEQGNGRLVVVHDELELGMGEVKVRDGAASAKGHNGLKDIARYMKGQKYMRIAVGIGRPESREPDVVAAYVLKKMSGNERMKIEGAVGRVEAALKRMMD